MAKKASLHLEAEELVSQLQAKIQARLDEANDLAAKEAALLAKADTAATTVATVRDLASELEQALKDLAPLAKILGETSDLKLALAAVKDEAKTLIDAGKLSEQELRLEAQILWEDKPELVALRKAQARVREAKDKADAEAKAKRTAEAQKALADIDLADLVEKYPKRVQEARQGKFPVKPEDKRGIRLEMLSRALRGMGFSPDVVAAVDLADAERAFGKAQAVAFKLRERGGQDPAAQAILDKATMLLTACGVAEGAIELAVTSAQKGDGLVYRIGGTVQGKGRGIVADKAGRWEAAVQAWAA